MVNNRYGGYSKFIHDFIGRPSGTYYRLRISNAGTAERCLMPLYAYRCADCADFEVQASMSQVRETLPCPECGTPAPRRFTAPNLSLSSSSAYKLIESTERTASEPAVVSSPGGRRRPAGTGVSRNPLHQKLPRPD